jgi:hypothetical protein
MIAISTALAVAAIAGSQPSSLPSRFNDFMRCAKSQLRKVQSTIVR